MLETILSTSYGGIAFYLGTGVAVLIIGWLLDSVIGPRHSAH
ncbi:MAG TPA: hypothetical protein VKC56_04125 [Gallionellaceae bacterium]|nr:hypothetical protein [Gallionellaceae bacterium]